MALLVWGFWELRTRDPLIDLRTTVRPRVLFTNAASVLIGVGMYAFMLIAPQLLQFPEATGYGLGQSMLAAGLWIAPGGVMMMLISPLGGKLINARGPKVALVCGALVIAVGYGAALPLMGTAWGIMLAGIVINSGVALAYGAMPALIMSSVPVSETAAANGFNTLMRSLGTTIGSAVIGVVLAQMTIGMGGVTIPSEDGFRTGLLIGCGVALLSAAVAALIPALRKADGDEAPDTAPARLARRRPGPDPRRPPCATAWAGRRWARCSGRRRRRGCRRGRRGPRSRGRAGRGPTRRPVRRVRSGGGPRPAAPPPCP
ncbi:hypothetical protein SALBM135S_00759 [Streptomyces alboniger]